MGLQKNAFEYLENAATTYENKIAFADESVTYTFGELKAASVSVGTALLAYGRKGGNVVVLADRNVLSLVGMFGALAAGRTYVPLDSKMPADRMGAILDKVRPDAILFSEKDRKTAEKYAVYAPLLSLEEALTTEGKEEVLLGIREKVLDIDPVYMIFTSGSTGVPKGIVISHRALIDFTEWMAEDCSMGSEEVLGNQAPFYFDLSVKDLYQTLRNGCTTHVLPKKYFMFPMLLVDALREKGITTLIWATSAFRMTADSGIFEKKIPASVKKIILGGEALQAKHLNIWKNALPQVEVINLYGPTEVTVDCTVYKINRAFADGEAIPIGRACRNMEVILLDEDLRPVPDGEAGEICVRGMGLALGYYGDWEKTEAAFVQNPLNPHYPDKLYRTGDIGRIGEDGELYFLSRRDDQIKHMGYRIELGEIETALSATAGVRSAVCFFDEKEDRIVCCAVLSDEVATVTAELKKRLPVYMLPGKWKLYDSLPLNANGKIHRVLLREQYEREKD